MDNPFGFLGQANPASLAKLLQKLPLEDAAVALAGLPAGKGVQVLAYFPEKAQGELMPAMRDARRSDPEHSAKTAARIRDMLMAAKYARDGHAGEDKPPAPPQAAVSPVKSYAPTPARPQSPPTPPAKKPAARPEPASGAPANSGKPVPWVPRNATASPINGPALPGKPPPVAGDPLKSPLAKAGLLDLIGRAQEKLLPKKNASVPPAPAARRELPSRSPAAREPVKKRPPAREGVVRSVTIDKTPRTIGPGAARRDDPPPSSGRRVDGKAILAAILREAGPKVRHTVQDDDPALFRELRGRMFFFDDLNFTEDSALAIVFTSAPLDEAALALKFAAPVLRDRVLRVVSPGRARALAEPTASRTGMEAIERAQQKVLDVAMQLQAAGRILIDPRDPDLANM